MSKRRVAAVQMCTTPNVEENLAIVERCTQQAAERGAETVFVPEAFAYLGPDEDKQKICEPLPAGGPILARCQKLASDTQTHLVLGGFHEASPVDKKNYNTTIHLDSRGNIVARYRKMHLFDVDLADGTCLHESAGTIAGDELVVTDVPFGRLGLTTCYDVRFPYVYQALTDLGAVAHCVPSAFTATTGAAHWHVLLRARAIETQSYIIAPAQYGHHWGTRHSYGHTLVIDPWGEVLDEVESGEGIALAEIDDARVRAVRGQLPSLQHRRSLN